uniref:Uncharacterized protein n=1 Tax=Acrobeloides nanus TaxID=290746 RepID=A0A914DPD8_9BILA
MSSDQTSLGYGEANVYVLNSCLPDVVPKLPTSFNSLVSPYDPSTWVNIPPLSTDKQANFKDDSFITTASTLMNTTVNFINGSESNNWSKIEAGQSFELRKSKKKKTQQDNAFDLSSSFAHGSKDAMMRPKNKEGLTLFNECAIYLGDYIEKPEQTNSELIESLIKRKVVESMNGDIHLTTNNFGYID